MHSTRAPAFPMVSQSGLAINSVRCGPSNSFLFHGPVKDVGWTSIQVRSFNCSHSCPRTALLSPDQNPLGDRNWRNSDRKGYTVSLHLKKKKNIFSSSDFPNLVICGFDFNLNDTVFSTRFVISSKNRQKNPRLKGTVKYENLRDI